MTELEWLHCTDPQPMLSFLAGKARLRQLRLFTCACLRQVGHLLTEESSRQAYRVYERFVEGEATQAELAAAHGGARQALITRSGTDSPRSRSGRIFFLKIYHAALAIDLVTREADAKPERTWELARSTALSLLLADSTHTRAENEQIRTDHCDLLRDIIGNPFQRPQLDPHWLGTLGRPVIQIARSIYEDRSFEELPVLADALLEADCPCPELIAHCQAAGEHGRGCWAVDLVRSVH